MKLRIRGNSIRLRLLRSEVAEFGETGVLRESANFGASSLTYVLQKTALVNKVTAEFTGDKIIVHLPVELANEWTTTDLVSLTSEQEAADNEKLKILVEKDFVCLDRPDDEDNKDAYPNISHKC